MNKTGSMDELAALALCEIVREDWDEMVSAAGGDARPVSRRCRRRIGRIIAGKRAERPKRGALRTLAVGILAALSALAMLGMAMKPVRAAFAETVVTWYDTHFGLRYRTNNPVPAAVEEVVLPAWLPDGWTLETNFHTDYLYSHTILDAGEGRISLDQHVIKPDVEMDRLDNRDVEIESVTLSGKTEAKLFSYADGRCALMWTDRYVFILKTNGRSADSGTLIRIAESMEP